MITTIIITTTTTTITISIIIIVVRPTHSMPTLAHPEDEGVIHD